METYESPRGPYMFALLAHVVNNSSLRAQAPEGGGELTPSAPPIKSILNILPSARNIYDFRLGDIFGFPFANSSNLPNPITPLLLLALQYGTYKVPSNSEQY